MSSRFLSLALRSVFVVAFVSTVGTASESPIGRTSAVAADLGATNASSLANGVALTSARATSRSVEWRREPGGSLAAVVVNPAGMIYVTGSIWARPVMPGTDVHVTAMVVAKYGAGGRLAWRRTWRPSGLWFADGTAVAPAPSGGIYVAGISGRYEGWAPVLWRYSASGRLMWRRTLPSSLGRGDLRSIAADAHGVVGVVHNSDTGGPTAGGTYIYSYTHAGRLAWRTEFKVPGITGTMNTLNGITIGDNGLVYMTGFVSRTRLDARYQDWDVVVQQLQRNGRVRWTRDLADPGVRDADEGLAIDSRPGMVVVAGSKDNWTRGAVWAFTSRGELRWARTWGHRDQTSAPAVSIAPWGPVYVAADRVAWGPGDTRRTWASLRRYAPDGTFVSSRAADDFVNGVATADAIYLVSGRALQRWQR